MVDQSVSGRVREVVEPVLAEDGLELFDIEQLANVLKVTIDRPGGVDLDVVSKATTRISEALDRADPVAGRYLLEVSSPGVERRLRTPAHFAGAVGSEIAVKTRPGVDGDRRFEGALESADDRGVVVAGRRLSYDDIEAARTKFVWPAPQGGKP